MKSGAARSRLADCSTTSTRRAPSGSSTRAATRPMPAATSAAAKPAASSSAKPAASSGGSHGRSRLRRKRRDHAASGASSCANPPSTPSSVAGATTWAPCSRCCTRYPGCSRQESRRLTHLDCNSLNLNVECVCTTLPPHGVVPVPLRVRVPRASVGLVAPERRRRRPEVRVRRSRRLGTWHVDSGARSLCTTPPDDDSTAPDDAATRCILLRAPLW
mmetsp:Transcript_1644/g.6348  ORF Transcript_1644/g.6348 Transcript_1644/m.6348 type:complete len:217 (+) Transcript_1644:690-1340(+)